ncbi:MAG: helix-hairpin-helix domain-containing protein [Elusimicrobia bacterium]|nr:helix-hairpin-helix domain-containing protein [Elusimicrobiota bacterium]
MYKEGINLNTVTVETLKTLPGIGDNLARSLALHRELKSEFVNPAEFSTIVPEHVYSGIAKDYNIYAVSPTVWKSRITNEKNKLYNSDFQIFFLEGSSLALNAENNVHIINLPPSGELRKSGIEDILHEKGALAELKKFFGWKPVVKTLIFTELPDMNKLNQFLERYETSSLFCVHEDEILNDGSKYKSIADIIMAKKIKVIAAPAKIKAGDFEIKMIYAFNKEKSSSCSLLLSFGSVSILLMFNMTDSDQMDFINNRTGANEIRPNAVYSYGAGGAPGSAEPLPAFMKFCGSPKLIDIHKDKKLISDGNLIYAEHLS